MTTDNGNPESYTATTSVPYVPQIEAPEAKGGGSKKGMIIFGVIALLVLIALIAFFVFLLLPGTDLNLVARLRDIFIIYMAIFSLFLGLATVILIVQIARLINLLQNEIKPILDSTNETVNSLRGTTQFLSDNLVQPVIRLNEYVAGLAQMFKLVGLARKRPRD